MARSQCCGSLTNMSALQNESRRGQLDETQIQTEAYIGILVPSLHATVCSNWSALLHNGEPGGRDGTHQAALAEQAAVASHLKLADRRGLLQLLPHSQRLQ